jgi:hypothetical protein
MHSYCAKVEIGPKGLMTLGVMAEIEIFFSICPKLRIINAELYGIGPKAEEKDTIKIGMPICNPQTSPLVFSTLTPSVKWALD